MNIKTFFCCFSSFSQLIDKTLIEAGPTVKAGGSSEEAGKLQGEQGVECSLYNGVVEADKFSEHLSDYHAEERCDSCGARV